MRPEPDPAAPFPAAQAASEARIQPLTPGDVPSALTLVRECGWNQVVDDWSWFLAQGEAFKVGTAQGVAATAAILPYDRGFGWISMVLVHSAQRRQGLATALLQRCMERLRELGVTPVLDATPAGREVYRQLGFLDGWAITRWRRIGSADGTPMASAVHVRALADDDWPQIAALDACAFGADRSALLRSLAGRSLPFACVAETGGRIAGYLLGRNGRVATQLGPLVARDAEVAQALTRHALARIAGPALMDVLERHTQLAAQLAGAGFAVERGYTRMALGRAPDFGDPQRSFAIGGPELG